MTEYDMEIDTYNWTTPIVVEYEYENNIVFIGEVKMVFDNKYYIPVI